MSPVVVGVVERTASRRGVSPETVVTEAAEAYLEALLGGDADGASREAVTLEATVSDGLRDLLGGADTDASTLVETALGTGLAPGSVGDTLPVPSGGFAAAGVAAVVDNPAFELDTPGAVVEAAVCRCVVSSE
ncbi:MAG: hypothetical protein J07HB67_00093 [halophilic archaeon J07HB67]|nr:MAG: hypothetical protein J07HB67_00093 [halophilic archaeon J07HB67]